MLIDWFLLIKHLFYFALLNCNVLQVEDKINKDKWKILFIKRLLCLAGLTLLNLTKQTLKNLSII